MLDSIRTSVAHALTLSRRVLATLAAAGIFAGVAGAHVPGPPMIMAGLFLAGVAALAGLRRNVGLIGLRRFNGVLGACCLAGLPGATGMFFAEGPLVIAFALLLPISAAGLATAAAIGFERKRPEGLEKRSIVFRGLCIGCLLLVATVWHEATWRVIGSLVMAAAVFMALIALVASVTRVETEP